MAKAVADTNSGSNQGGFTTDGSQITGFCKSYFALHFTISCEPNRKLGRGGRKSGTDFHCPKSNLTLKSGVMSVYFSVHCELDS
jgi:hypothetical protein